MKTIALTFLLAFATLSLGTSPEPISCTETIKGSVKDVWAAFSTKKGQESWMVAHSEIDLRVGGLMRTHYQKGGKIGDPGTIENLIVCYDPERMISLKIAKAPATFPWKKAAQETWTVVYFEPVSSKETKVTVRMLGWTEEEESKAMRKFFEAGNKQTLDGLKAYIEGKKNPAR